MSNLKDPWHFARPDLAKAYLNSFDLGLTAARGLFARRRMGKSEFLKHDLVPAAVRDGYLAAYTNLWDATDHPGQALASAILLATRPKDLRKEKIAVPAIQAALQAADKTKKQLLLVIDEAQVLAAPEHLKLAHALRAGLDIRKPGIKVLFAGSSEAALRDMFSRVSAPFYNWAPVEPFPLLGRDFVAAMVRQLAKVAKHPLKLDEALKAYASLKETPEFFRWYIERYVMYQSQGSDQALAYTKARVHDDASYAKSWKELSRADRAVLLMAARGVQDLYGGAALKQLQQMLGPEVTTNVPRASIRRLTGLKLQLMARVDHGAYRFEDPEFQAWVAARRTID